MSRRPSGTPGSYRPAMENTCGHDNGYTDGPRCGKPATVHLTAGSPEEGPGDWAMMACDEHAPAAKPHSWDWHEVSGACDVPGSMWHSGKHRARDPRPESRTRNG